MIQSSTRKKLIKVILTGLLASLGTMYMALKPKPSLGAERISFSLPVLGEFYISVDSLEVFAKEGIITQDFEFYAKRLDKSTLAQLRRALQQEFEINPTAIYKLTNAPIGEEFLKQLGEVVYTHRERNGIYAIRSALFLAASDSEGLSAINVIKHFPTEEIKVNTNLIFSLIKQTGNFLRYNETTVQAISQQANKVS